MTTYEGIIDYARRVSEAGDARVSEDGDRRIAEQYNPESVGVGDSIGTQMALNANLSESVSSNDSMITILAYLLSESVSLSDSVLVAWIAGSVVSESISVSDVIRYDHNWLTIEGNETFALLDILRIKDGVNDEWLLIVDVSQAPLYGVIRDMARDYADGSNPEWTEGATVVNYGQSGDGVVYMTASESNAPYLSVFDHAGEPWNTITTRLRLGNLNGFLGYSTDLYGIAIGETDKYLKYDPTNGLRIQGNITISGNNGFVKIYDAGPTERVRLGNLNGFLGYTTDKYGIAIGETNKYLKYDPTNGLRLKGNVIITGGSGILSFSDAGALAVLDQVTAGEIDVISLAAIAADLGTITAGNITIDASGFIRSSGKDNYADDTAGFFLGYDTDAYKFNLGGSTKYLKWDGSVLTIRGIISIDALSALNADLGTITAGNITINSSGFLRSSGKDNYADTTAGFFLGYDTDAYKLNIGTGTKYLKFDGTNLTIRGTLNADDITAGTLAVARIAASSIEAGKLTISTLSAISANLGTITAGSMSAARITSGTLNADRIGATSINAGKIVVGTLTATQIYAEAYLGGKRLDDYGSGCVDVGNYATLTITHNLGRHAIVMGYLNDGVTYHAARIINHTDTSFGIYNWNDATLEYCYSYI